MDSSMTMRGASWQPDRRFQSLLEAESWVRLPSAVRRRFGRRLSPGAAITYVGTIAECRRNRVGSLIAQLARLIGAPLPLHDDIAVAAVVTVTEEDEASGQVWTRMYARAQGLPQVIHSRKRFAGPTGLEEYLGGGFGISLMVCADDRALHFISDHYFISFGSIRLTLPSWLSPGTLTISHLDRGDDGFAFVLSLRHALFGEVIHQVGLFGERFDSCAQETSHD